MKLLITIAFACTLISKVHPLNCYECLPMTPGEVCSQIQSSKTCPASQTKCISATGAATKGAKRTTVHVRSCVPSSRCVNGSLNFGISRTTVSTKCCDTNLCNNQSVPALPESNPNGRKCFTCVGNNCSNTLECEGPEDRCIKATVLVDGRTVTAKGCASQSICSGAVHSQAGNFGLDVNCCEGNMCNNALRIEQSILFLLLVPLASFNLFN